MYLQLFVCFIALVLYFSFTQQGYYKTNRQAYSYINIMIVILILQSALRNVAVGADTYAYSIQFEQIVRKNWSEILAAFPETYIEGRGKDPGYMVFEKVVHLITSEYQIFLFVVATFFFIGLAKMLKYMQLNIKSVCVAILVYEVLFYDFFSITGIRQTIATGFFFYAFPLIEKKKLIPYIIIVAIGATIHKSCLMLLPFYILAGYKKPRKLLICSLIALPFLFGVARTFARYITSFQLFESYSYYAESTYETSGAVNFMLFLIVISVLTLIATYKLTDGLSYTIRVSINALSLAVLFVPLSWVDPSLMRVCQYFSIFSMFILGPVLQKCCAQYNLNFKTILLCVFILFSAVIIKRGQDYAFFWQEMELPENYKSQRA